MTEAAVPFGDAMQSGLPAVAGASPLALNVMRDMLGTVRRRPGIQAKTGLPADVVDSAGIVGLYQSLDGSVFAVADAPSRSFYLLSSSARDLGYAIKGTGRPTFAETEMLLVTAGGDEIVKFPFATELPAPLGGNPPKSTHVIANNLRLLANDADLDTTKLRYSYIAIGKLDYSGNETWTDPDPNKDGYITAESSPDPIAAVYVNTSEVWVFGTQSLQLFVPDATYVYTTSVTRNLGCGAPYSPIRVDQEFAWLDNRRRFVISDGRSYNVISDAIKLTLDQMTTVSDCFGYRAVLGPLEALVWTFPTDGRTLVYQPAVQGWSQWSGQASGVPSPMSILSHALGPNDSSNLVGTTDGHVGELSFSATTDLGAEIPAVVETGYLDRGTESYKQSARLRLAFQRSGVATAGPHGFITWRDRPGPWEQAIPIDLGPSSDREAMIELASLGTYRRRQWKFTFNGTEELILAKATETFTVGAD